MMSVSRTSRRILLSALVIGSLLAINLPVTMGDMVIHMPTMPSVTKPLLWEHGGNHLVSVGNNEGHSSPQVRSRGFRDQRFLISADAVPVSSFRSSYAGRDCGLFGVRTASMELAPLYAIYLKDNWKGKRYSAALSTAGPVFVAGLSVPPHAPTTSQRLLPRHGGNRETFASQIPGPVPFAACAAKADLTIYHPTQAKQPNDAFKIKGTFMLGRGSNGIAPLSEVVILHVGTFVTTIPIGSFMLAEGEFRFQGVIKGVTLAAVIRPVFYGNSYEFTIEGGGAELAGTVNPVTIGLIIGDDGGSTTVQADIR